MAWHSLVRLSLLIYNPLLDELNIDYIIRVKGSVNVFCGERWVKLNTIRFEGNARQRNLGRLYYCEKSPRRLCSGLRC